MDLCQASLEIQQLMRWYLIMYNPKNNNDKIILTFISPCLPFQGPYNCAVYDRQYEIPVVPFILKVA